MQRFFPGLLCLLLLSACSVSQRNSLHKTLKIKRSVEHSAVFSKSFTGFSLFDPAARKMLVDVQGDHYFTPASTTKILTLAASLALLPDTLPGMQLISKADTLWIRGTADPTFLHPRFQHWQTCRDTLLSPAYNAMKLCYAAHKLKDARFAPGWAWEDYNEGFQPERSTMPIYGNCVLINADGKTKTTIQPALPEFAFGVQSSDEGADVVRMEHQNFWKLKPNTTVENEVSPMYSVPVARLLSDTLHREIADLADATFDPGSLYPVQTIPSTPLDTVLRRMMYQSDNFVSEQLLLMCSGAKFNVFQQEQAIQWVLDSLLKNLPQRPKWVDGSGLSRYNLNTPNSLIAVLDHLWQNYPTDRLLALFPAGGQQGTIGDWYAGPEGKPYVFAKTGSMGGVQCLSGYVVCKSGKVLIFSFMHNNFVGSGKPWKQEMQRILEMVRLL